MVKDYIFDSRQDIPNLNTFLPNTIFQDIAQIEIGVNENADIGIWSLENTGNFSCSSAFDMLRQRQTKDPMAAHIWGKGIPFKVSFFM